MIKQISAVCIVNKSIHKTFWLDELYPINHHYSLDITIMRCEMRVISIWYVRTYREREKK